VLSALVSPIVVADARGTGIASAQTVVALGRFAASVLFGAMWVTIGRSSALLVFAAVLTLVIPVAAWLLRAKGTRAGSCRWARGWRREPRWPAVVLGVIILLAAGGSLWYVLHRRGVEQEAIRHSRPVATRLDLDQIRKAPYIVFRNTALGNDYGPPLTSGSPTPTAPASPPCSFPTHGLRQ
jgi:hypothetical protein